MMTWDKRMAYGMAHERHLTFSSSKAWPTR